jgi:uncharacterized protein
MGIEMKIETLEQLRGVLGQPNPVIDKKIYPELNPRMQYFVENAPQAFIATVGNDGFPTTSPKGDAPGFIQIEKPSTLLIPERKGNKVAITCRNILAGSKVALLLVVPGTHEVLRIHGSAELIYDAALNERLASRSHSALLVTRVTVENCYFHCGKAFMRSKLFSEELEHKHISISLGEELSGNGAFDAQDAKAFDEGVKTRYQTDL